MAVVGAHVLLYSSEPERLRAMLGEVFGWRHVDAGEGWLIFALPPAELGVHPVEGEAGDGSSPMRHELSLMCDDIESTLRDLRAKGVEVAGEPEDHGYGIVAELGLPGGVKLLLYEPRHASPIL